MPPIRSSLLPLVLVLVLPLLLPCASAFDVVGWYVGTNTTAFPLASIRWDIYSTLRLGYVQVDPRTGNASCPTDAFFTQSLAAARAHNRSITLGHGESNLEACIYNASTNATLKAFCDRYVETVGPAVRSCGAGVAGIEVDHEGDHTTLGKAGIVSAFERTGYSRILDGMQKSMGGDYTVSADLGAWGISGAWGHGDTYPVGLTPWVDKDIFASNKKLFVNTMSYYWPEDCSTWSWKKDGWVTNMLWGIAKDQINIGIGYYQ